jgi:hypothetical protein
LSRPTGELDFSTRKVIATYQHERSARHRWDARIELQFSCEGNGRVTLATRRLGRWMPQGTSDYRCRAETNTSSATMKFDGKRAVTRLRRRTAFELKLTFAEVPRATAPTATSPRHAVRSHRTITLRSKKRKVIAHATANMWWKQGDAICRRSDTGGDAGTLVIDVSPYEDFGASLGERVEWQTWVYVWDPYLPAGQRGRWIAHPVGWFSYTVSLLARSGGGITLYPGGGAGFYVGGDGADTGLSGNQVWTVPYGLWVMPALAIRRPGAAEWNYVNVREASEGVYQGNGWCLFG